MPKGIEQIRVMWSWDSPPDVKIRHHNLSWFGYLHIPGLNEPRRSRLLACSSHGGRNHFEYAVRQRPHA
jgi:hypothetical protein